MNRMSRQEIERELLKIFAERFEIEDPGLDEDLREAYQFDSIDGIDLFGELEVLLGAELSDDQKRGAMSLRTINGICDYVVDLMEARA